MLVRPRMKAHEDPTPRNDSPHDAFDPDAEALRLAMKVVAHAKVARSFARIAAGIVQESARQASTVLRAYAGGRIARAAAGAASEVTAAEIARVLGALEKVTPPRPAAEPQAAPPVAPAVAPRPPREDAA